MRTFYTALDPSLERIVELIQTWIWWDLADACDIVSYEHQVQLINKVKDIKLEGPIMDHYQKIFRKTASEIDKKMVIDYELGRLDTICEKVTERRTMDAGFEMIVKRDVIEDKSLGAPYDYKQKQLRKLKAILEQLKKQVCFYQ